MLVYHAYACLLYTSIQFRLLNNPVEILGDESKHVVGLKCVKMRLGEPDASGRRGVTPIAVSYTHLV